MVDRFRHMSIRTRLALGAMVPLGFAAAGMGMAWVPAITASAGAGRFALLSVALLFVAIGTGLVLLQINTQAVQRPLEDASQMMAALMQGQYGRHVRVRRMDETGRLLVALEQFGDYLAVMLPEADHPGRGKPQPPGTYTSTLAHSLAQIAEQLHQEDDVFDAPVKATPKASPAHRRQTSTQA
jgi:hypothetical protein